jgi:hypothetical protein
MINIIVNSFVMPVFEGVLQKSIPPSGPETPRKRKLGDPSDSEENIFRQSFFAAATIYMALLEDSTESWTTHVRIETVEQLLNFVEVDDNVTARERLAVVGITYCKSTKDLQYLYILKGPYWFTSYSTNC